MLRAENKNNNGKISFKGRYYNVSNVECNPKPIQKPGIPIWIGGGGKKTQDCSSVCRWLELWVSLLM
jgi:alkanesulfonate monooxygenase SsuD/methylene tetrahydromethanopterin reductase-like flavin-dependent oxidoreductase (luciferase family)